MKLIALILIMTGHLANAKTMSCQVSEKFAGKEASGEVQFEFANKTGVAEFQSLFGAVKIELNGEQMTAVVVDSKLNKPITAKFAAAEGDSSRLQIIPNEKTDDYFMMDCQIEGHGVGTAPTGAICNMNEIAGSQKFSTEFEIPLAQNGHDFTELPQAKIAPLAGWVMLYNGVLITFIQNKDVYTGITGMGSWSQPVSLSWFPSSQNIKVELTCIPK